MAYENRKRTKTCSTNTHAVRSEKKGKSQCDAIEAVAAEASRTGTFVQNLNLSTLVKIYYSQLRLSHAHTHKPENFYEIQT